MLYDVGGSYVNVSVQNRGFWRMHAAVGTSMELVLD